MPRSKRPRRTGTQSFLNRLRGEGRTLQVLKLARTASATGHLETISWALRNLRIDGPLSSLQPRRLSQLHALPGLEALPIQSELAWAEGAIKLHARHLNAAFEYRDRVEERLVAGDGDCALQILDDWERDVGPSLCLMSVRIAVLQVSRGLEAQKDEVARIKTAGVPANLNFFAYWWSVRAEDGSSWRNFARDFERRLKLWDVSAALRAHIGFQVLGTIPATGDEALLLSASLHGSALDLYEAFLATARTCIVESRPSRDSFSSCAKSLMQKIEDPRLFKLAFLTGEFNRADSIGLAPTTMRDAALGLNGSPQSGPPLDVAELFHFAPERPVTTSRSNLPDRIQRALEELRSPGGVDRGTADLQKLGAMFDHLPLGAWLAHSPSFQLTESLDPRQASHLFASTKWFEPETLGALTHVQREAIINIRREIFPDTPSWLWNEVITGYRTCVDVLDRFSPQAAAELLLAETVRDDNPRSILAAIFALNRVAQGPTRTSMRAEIGALLATEGLQAALVKTTDYLLQRPEFASWLPLADLAAAVQRGDLPTTLIDVPIILDFAAKNANPALAPLRTYAAEDFLLASRAAHPAELCRTIDPPSATQRQIYFFGEVCTPSGLRTSTMFNNERELEADRLAVCRWLASTSLEDPERYEDEARELVRSRHIQLGVQALQGSKLSIDRTGLRRWAERTVAEDFQRYMDLLEQGIFTPDQAFREQVYAAVEAGVDTQSLNIPDNEAATLFAHLTSELMREFALHPEHGLDAYLSLRIRHGTLSGHMRGPAEREHLVTRRDATGRYHENDYWTERLADEIEHDNLELIEDALLALSRRLDELISNITQNLIQVRREEKPQGMLTTDPSPATIALMIAETRSGQNFDDFFFRCEETFWAFIGQCAPRIRECLSELKSEADRIFDGTEDAVRSVAAEGAGSLKDALLRARASVLGAIDAIGDWLTPPTTPDSIHLPVEDLVRVSLSVICGFYRDFEPKVTYDIRDLPNFSGVVRLFSDIFFILFENVLKYSGNPINPSIYIHAWIDEDQMRFRVENSVETVTKDDLTRIANAKERIANGSFRRAVRGEGGTGLPKLAKVIGLGSGGGTLEFEITENDKKFAVDFSLRLLELTQDGNDQR